MSELGFMDALLRAARPRAMGALLRYFRTLDTAEEAFQEACLAALKHWPKNGPPRDPAAWLILVGRNAALDVARKEARQSPLPDEAELSCRDDEEAALLERLDEAHYRDDILRLLFICCQPELPAVHQIALAMRVVCGLSIKQIARAFLVSEDAMEQRITRAKAHVKSSHAAFETPGAHDRLERLGAVCAVLYLMFNEGYAATGGEAHLRTALCEEAIRMARLLLRLFPSEPGLMGLLALMLLQHARSRARLDAEGEIVLLEAQDRALWDRASIQEGLALIDKALRHGAPDPYQLQAGIAAMHARAPSASDTDWSQIERLYAALERLSPSPVVTLNRAVALAKVRGPEQALLLIEPLSERLGNYFYFFGVKGALLMQLGRLEPARAAFNRAIALAHSAAEAAHIRMQLDRLGAQAGS